MTSEFNETMKSNIFLFAFLFPMAVLAQNNVAGHELLAREWLRQVEKRVSF